MFSSPARCSGCLSARVRKERKQPGCSKNGGMGQSLSQDLCQCGVGGPESRAIGKLDANWKAPPTLVRIPSVKRDKSRSSLGGKLPGDDEVAEMDGNRARVLAARLLSDAKNGRTRRIQALFEAYDMDKEQSQALCAAVDQAAGNTALMLAAMHGYTDCCELLLQKGSDPNVHNRQSHTAVGLRTVARTLHGHAAAEHVPCDRALAWADLAASHGYSKTVELLKKHGAVDFPVM